MSDNIKSCTINNSNIIYHYCSCDKFYKIIKHKELWLTYYKHMNDYKEKEYLYSILRNVIDHETKLNKINNFKLDFFLQEFNSCHFFDQDSFYACFSKSQDSLSQWVRYADNARGFAIGFDRNSFVSEFNKNDYIKFYNNVLPFHLLDIKDIEYEDINAHNTISEILNNYLGNQTINDTDFKQNFIDACRLIVKLSELCNYIKNPFFKEEQECRLVFNNFLGFDDATDLVKSTLKNSIMYRVIKNGISPYFALDLSKFKNPIRRIILGPKNSSIDNNIHNFIMSFFSNSDFDIEIIKSKGSYR